MFHPRDLRKLYDAFGKVSAHVEAESKLPSSFEIHADADGTETSLPRFETEGHVHETPSRLESSGELCVERNGPDELHELRLVESAEKDDDTAREETECEMYAVENDETYVVEGRHRVPADSTTAVVVSSAESVGSLFDSMLNSFSEYLGEVVETKVEKHRFDRDESVPTDFVEAEYAVRLVGLGEIAETKGENLRVEEAELTVKRGDELRVDWDFDVRNHGTFFAEVFAEESGTHDVLTARRRSDFAGRIDWRARNRDGFLLDVEYEAENASRYTEELRRHGFRTPERAEFGFELDTHGTTTSGSFDYEADSGPDTFGERFGAWAVFLPLPVVVLLHRD
ncbi:MAG: hypothetical protein U5J64_10985 [Halobacteriales archaeon]|nr:hypothetical protein [Halobacteriales archaeon]